MYIDQTFEELLRQRLTRSKIGSTLFDVYDENIQRAFPFLILHTTCHLP